MSPLRDGASPGLPSEGNKAELNEKLEGFALRFFFIFHVLTGREAQPAGEL